jgi:hypothetical protein
MKLHHHVAFSTTISVFLFLVFKSWYLSVTCLLSGILIDLDHFIDYYREQGINLDIKNFFTICENAQFERVFLVLHGWEWILLCAAAGWVSGWNPLVTGVAIGLGQHLILDAFYNSTSVRTYSIIWRWSKGFVFDSTFPTITPIKYRYRDTRDRD